MTSKILFASLIAALLLWQYSTINENTQPPTGNIRTLKKIDLSNASDSKFKSRKNKTNYPLSSAIQVSKTVNTVALKHHPSHVEILNLLAKITGNEDLDAIVLTLKAKFCPECLNSLKQIIADSAQYENVRANAALILAKIGSENSVISLIQSLHENSEFTSEDNILQRITSQAISAINDPEGIGALASILTGQQAKIIANQLSYDLATNMTKAIASYSDKDSVAYEITKQYWATQNPEIQKAIINLNHPQTLALLAIDAKDSGDFLLQNNVMEKLTSNAHGDSLDALMSLVQNDPNQYAELSAQINQWTKDHINTDWQGHLIDYLSSPTASTEQRIIAAESLSNILKTPDLVSVQESTQIQEALNKFGSTY